MKRPGTSDSMLRPCGLGSWDRERKTYSTHWFRSAFRFPYRRRKHRQRFSRPYRRGRRPLWKRKPPVISWRIRTHLTHHKGEDSSVATGTILDMFNPQGAETIGTMRVTAIADQPFDQQIRNAGLSVMDAMLSSAKDQVVALATGTAVGQDLIATAKAQQQQQAI